MSMQEISQWLVIPHGPESELSLVTASSELVHHYGVLHLKAVLQHTWC